MKKILIIPSWYPLEKDRLPGFFFREQALLIKDHFEFRVLYGKQKIVNIFLFLYYLIIKYNCYLNLLTPPEGRGFLYFSFRVPYILRIFSPLQKLCEHINYSAMVNQYKKESKRINWSPDLIHAHSVFDGGIAAHALAKHLSIPFMITEHQVFLPGNYSNYKRKLIKKAFEAANKVLAVSEHQKRQILMNNINCSPIVVGNFVDENVFYPQNISREKIRFTILFITYDSYIKDNETFFKALSHLCKRKVLDFRVMIIGGDLDKPELIDEENPLFQLAKKYAVTEFVKILNFIDRGVMPQYINQSDLLVSTSIAETFGVAQVETMMCGIPVIATANGGIDDFISKENGIKIPIQDYKALADAILKIKNREVLFDKTEIRNSVLNKYGKTAFSGRLINIYNNVST